MSKLIRGYNSFVAQNGDSLREVDILLLAKNSVIANFSDESSC